MQWLRNTLDKQAPLFEKGGKLEKLHPLYEMADTFLFTPGMSTKGATHVRDALDLKRMMMIVAWAATPCVLMAMYNTGYQSHLAIEGGGSALDTWQTSLYAMIGLGYDSHNPLANFIHGAFYFIPVFLVCNIAGGFVEVIFSSIRKHEVNEGFLVTGILFPLTLPPTIPLWQVAIGIMFGVLFAKEVFGGTGFNFLNVALTARAFLFFAYPAQISGDVWVAANSADGVSAATWLTRLSSGETGIEGMTYFDAFIGLIPGSMGETSALACLIGAIILIVMQIGSWRTMLGAVAGTALMGLLLNSVGSDTNPMMNVPFHYHYLLGGWAFGIVFMATDPVSSAFTDTGKLVYGFGIGVMALLVRCLNPAYPEGVMLAILFMNIFAPLIDHFVVQANIKRRKALYGKTKAAA